MTTADWAREHVGPLEWCPSRQLLRTIRLYDELKQAGVPRRALAPIVATYRFWSVITGADIPLNAHIDGGLLMPHPQGIVIHPDAHIGPNCLLMQQTTIGVGPKPGLPVLEGRVDVGAGAKVLGGVNIGWGAKIGANAVVIDDVPPGATVVGVPARVVDRSTVVAA
ncbi:MAG: serine acetyltransferase [Myxococcales bacterium]|nr:serine acetyltransferase [Myxococcales bacterium]